MAFVSLMIFAGALLSVAYVGWFTLMPALPRMAALLRGDTDPAALPVPQIRIRDRRLKARAATAQLRTAIRAAA